MKKSICIILTVFAINFNANAQTFVSTAPANANVLLEEYTGVTCNYCPDGHRIANEIATSFPNRVFSINIHQGNFAIPSATLPDYRTEFGDMLAQQAQVDGYPAGTINRRIFPAYGTTESISRSNWASAVNIVLAEQSCVNIAAQSSIDFTTRQLTVDVEVYYTANSDAASNWVNVALLQNNVLGPQLGMSYNPTQIVGDLYRHNHMLRHLLTGQWGDELTATTAGTFVSRRYTYTIPEHLNNVPLVLEDLDVVVFVAEGRKVVLNAAKSSMLFLNANPRLGEFTDIYTDDCMASVSVEVKNFWNDQAIHSIDFSILANGNTGAFQWADRTIAPTATDTVILPAMDLIPNEKNTISVAVTAINGQPIAFDAEYTLEKMRFDVYANTKIKVVTDKYGSQITCELVNANGDILLTAGPWNDLSYSGISPHTIDLSLTEPGCYVFKIFDSAGNGINSGSGSGYIEILDGADNQIYRFDGKFKELFGVYLNSNGVTDIKAVSAEKTIHLFPNPVANELRIANYEFCESDFVRIFDITGKVVLSAQFPMAGSIDVSSLKTGLYVVKIHCKHGAIIQKIVKL
jgi:hypothetical protein